MLASTSVLLTHSREVKSLTAIGFQVLDGNALTQGNLLLVLTCLMNTVTRFTNLNGLQKKALVMATLKQLIDQSTTLTITEKSELGVLTEVLIPVAIELLLDAANNKFVFKVRTYVRKWWMICWDRCTSTPAVAVHPITRPVTDADPHHSTLRNVKVVF
jgi:hypothetical protein